MIFLLALNLINDSIGFDLIRTFSLMLSIELSVLEKFYYKKALKENFTRMQFKLSNKSFNFVENLSTNDLKI